MIKVEKTTKYFNRKFEEISKEEGYKPLRILVEMKEGK